MSAAHEIISALVAGGMDAVEAASLVARAAVEMTVSGPSAGALRTRKWRHKTSQSVTCDTEKPEPENVTKRHKTSQSVTCDNAPLSSSNLSIKKKERRGSRIPEDWRPDRDLAKQLGWSDAQIDLEAENFRDYWTAKPGSGGCKLDWPATWRQWVRNSRVKPAGSVPGHVVNPEAVNWRAVLQSYKNFGNWPKGHGNDPTSPSCRAPPELLREYGFAVIPTLKSA